MSAAPLAGGAIPPGDVSVRAVLVLPIKNQHCQQPPELSRSRVLALQQRRASNVAAHHSDGSKIHAGFAKIQQLVEALLCYLVVCCCT